MPDFAGGGEKLVYEMAKNLQRRGVKVKILTTGNHNIKEFEGIPTIRLKRNRFLMNFAFFSIWKHAKTIDLIQTSNYNACFPSWLVGKLMGKPVVCFVFGLYGKRWLKMRGWLKGTVSRIIEKIQVNRSYEKILFLSNYSKEWGTEIGIPEKRSAVISPGVELEKYKSGRKEPFVLFSGRYAKQKGVYDLIKVARLLPNIKFVMMGWGEEESQLKKMAPKNVEFSNLSMNSGKPFFEMYSKANIFFLPSYGETFGFVLVEAMASGCPIVSTIPLGYEGFVVKPGNVKQMAKAINYLIKNPVKAKELGKKNIDLAQKFTWDKFTDKLLGVYGTILKTNL